MRHADAIVYVFHGQPFSDDVAFLEEWSAVTDTKREVAPSAFGVMSHADLSGGSPWGHDDPIEQSRRTARSLAERHLRRLGSVIALAGHMAESACTGRIGEREAAALASLRGVDELDLELRDERVGGAGGGMDPQHIDRLASVVGEYGLRFGREPARGGGRALLRWMIDRSGIEELREALALRYLRRYPFVKVRHAMDTLDRLAWTAGAPPRLRDLMAEARLRPELHPLTELDALERLASQRPGHELLSMLESQLAAEDDAARLRMAGRPGPAQVRERAVEWIGTARRFASNEHDPAVAHALRTLERSFAHVARRAHDG